jgi:cytochrome P450
MRLILRDDTKSLAFIAMAVHESLRLYSPLWAIARTERAPGRHRFAYFPFSGGPRGCIGFPVAMLEMPLVLARILQRFRLELVPGHPVEHEAAISLRQRYGALMTLERA